MQELIGFTAYLLCMRNNEFEQFWSKYSSKPLKERRDYVDSLSTQDRNILFNSFFADGWYDLFLQNEIDIMLNYVKDKFDIDLIDIRIKALKYNKIFLVEKSIWDNVLAVFNEYDTLYDIKIVFGGLSISSWGKLNQFYVIRRSN